MTIKNSFEVYGNWLFQHRGYIPLFIFLLVIPISFFTPYNSYSSIHGFNQTIFVTSLFFIFLGHFIRAATVGKRKTQTSGRNRSQQVAKELNKTGLYSIVRHPLYLGNYFIWLSLAIYLSNFWFVIVLSLLFWLYYERIMFAEECFLELKFKEEFSIWANKTPAFIPSLKNYISNPIPFSFRVVLKNEYPGILSSATSFFFICILKRFVLLQSISFQKSDLIFLLIIALFGFSCKLIKKYTSFFEPMD